MPIFSIRKVYKEIIKGEAFKLKRNFGNQNVSKFRKMLKIQNWNNVFFEECVQTAFSEVMKIITSSFNECCSLEKVKVIYKNRHDWVTKELKADMKKREEMFKLSKKDPTEHNIQAHKKIETWFCRGKDKLKENISKNCTIKVSINKITRKLLILQDF